MGALAEDIAYYAEFPVELIYKRDEKSREEQQSENDQPAYKPL